MDEVTLFNTVLSPWPGKHNLLQVSVPDWLDCHTASRWKRITCDSLIFYSLYWIPSNLKWIDEVSSFITVTLPWPGKHNLVRKGSFPDWLSHYAASYCLSDILPSSLHSFWYKVSQRYCLITVTSPWPGEHNLLVHQGRIDYRNAASSPPPSPLCRITLLSRRFAGVADN